MNPFKSFLRPLKEVLFSLRDSSDPKKAHNIYNSLAQVFKVDESWKVAGHRELLEKVSTQLGHHLKSKTPWEGYKAHLQSTFDNIDAAFENYDLLRGLANEDPASLRWYTYLMKYDCQFKNRLDLLNQYLAQRQVEFNRYELSNLSMFGVVFTISEMRNDLNSLYNRLVNNPDPFYSVDDFQDILNQKRRRNFFKSVMGWLYLYDSQLLYCDFAYDDLRNAIFHNVDCRYSCFSKEEESGDIMGADFSFCDASFADFSYCYVRDTKFYNTKLDYAKFDHANLVGPLFINSSLKNVSFANIDGKMLRNASFRNSNLQGADFTDVELINVDFRGADLRNIKGIKSFLHNSVHIDEKTCL